MSLDTCFAIYLGMAIPTDMGSFLNDGDFALLVCGDSFSDRRPKKTGSHNQVFQPFEIETLPPIFVVDHSSIIKI